MPPAPANDCHLLLGFYRSGAFETIGDFNDAAFIAEIGRKHSLPFVFDSERPSRSIRFARPELPFKIAPLSSNYARSPAPFLP